MSSTPPAPFKGLRAFEDSELDVPYFFGRERERGLLEANLMASRLTVLYGETGVGKSSLLRAGVAHHLRRAAAANLARGGEPEHAVVVFASWRDDPVAELRRACAAEVTRALGGTAPPPDTPAPLGEALLVWQQLLGGDLYIVLDQAEEYFLYHQGEDGPGTFAAEFPEVVSAHDLRVNFLLAIREDAVAKLDAFKPRLPNVLGNYLRLEHLDRDAARAAITGPVARYNEGAAEPIGLEPALVDAVLDQVAAGADGRVETPHLQLVMQRLWDEELDHGSRELRLETLTRLGGATRIVGEHVARALAALPPGEQDLAAAMFDHLVTPSGTKIALEVDDLARYAHSQPPSVVAVLDKLGGDRIVRSVAANGSGGRYEIFHDVLAQPVLAWKTAHESERERRRLLRLVVLAAAAVTVMAGITVFALLQRSDARRQARLAGARQAAAEALTQLQVDPQRSLALAIRSAHVDPGPRAADVLRQALVASRELTVLPSTGAVRAVAFDPSGRLVATASDDGVARIWRRDGTLVHALRHRAAVTAVSFSADGQLVLTASRDDTARLWSAKNGRLLAVLRHGGPVTSASFTPDQAFVVTSSADGTARLWTRTGGLVVTVHAPGQVTFAMVSPDGRNLATLSQHRVLLYALPGGRLRGTLGARGVTTVAFAPRGREVVTGGADHTVRVWQTSTLRRIRTFPAGTGTITFAAFAPGGGRIVATSTDGATRVWNARTGIRTFVLLGHTNAVLSAAFSRGGRYLVTASADGTARIWEPAAGKQDAVLRRHEDGIVAATFSPDADTVATAGLDDTARLWDPALAPDLHVVARPRVAVSAAVFGPDGRTILFAAGREAQLRSGGRITRTFPHPAEVTSAIFGAGGRVVITADIRGTVRVWDAGTGRLLRTAAHISRGPLAANADGSLLATPDAIVDAASLHVVRRLPTGGATRAAFSPDGKLVATAGRDGEARLWNAGDGALVRTLAAPHPLTDVAFSADGTKLAVSSVDHTGRIWDLATGAALVLRGHFGAVFGIAFNPDGDTVVTAGPTTAGLWSTTDGRLIMYLHGPTGPLTAASFSPDGRRILTAGRDGTVRIGRCELCGGVDTLVRNAEQRLAALSRHLTAAARQRFVPSG